LAQLAVGPGKSHRATLLPTTRQGRWIHYPWYAEAQQYAAWLNAQECVLRHAIALAERLLREASASIASTEAGNRLPPPSAVPEVLPIEPGATVTHGFSADATPVVPACPDGWTFGRTHCFHPFRHQSGLDAADDFGVFCARSRLQRRDESRALLESIFMHHSDFQQVHDLLVGTFQASASMASKAVSQRTVW
jgi:hypothetical protein